ncbi:hypothetical protein [Mesorhizobium sp.]|uniref:hypothetical protein n=1 Tax=Mesorhizobium sp. TaxID=1871066 RepID=UPI000FE7AFC9|nr:hypothetical protein [Mesorhizobium sp.]RWD81333.1 MAG: hypothetical protein EOS48_16775 [Mesorhizobium sp.]
MTKLFDLGPPITGRRRGDSPKNGSDDFYICPICAQPVDIRDLRQVIWHDKPVHDRLEMDA